MTQHCFPRSRLGRLALAVGLVAGACTSVQASPSAVGQVSLVIGEAHVLRSDGSREAIRRGASIMVGDRVQTAGNGHVHVRFVDNGVVSVRPESTLEVQSYRYDAQNPAANEVRLKLEQGASRSISGAATEHDKSRFRLNTPIAAIGVRGTDFIVQTDPAKGVQATVADGAIVVAPFAADCNAGTLGPCGGEAVRVLSAGMGHLMAEVRPGEARTRLVPAAGTVLAAAAVKSEDGHGHGRPQGDSLTYSANDRAAADLLTIAKVNVTGLNRAADLSSQLVWGRWGVAEPTDSRMEVTASLASLGRHYTGIGDAEAGLYRTHQTQPGGLFPDSLSASVDFRLTRASASFEKAGTVESATVDGGTLTIDFGRRTFATGLSVSSPTGGSAEVRAGGEVRSNGTFAVRDAEQVVAGSLSVDGKEAGYLFERSSGGGLFKGRTLWGQPPGR